MLDSKNDTSKSIHDDTNSSTSEYHLDTQPANGGVTTQRLEDNVEYLADSINRINMDVIRAYFGLLGMALLICYLIYPYTSAQYVIFWMLAVAALETSKTLYVRRFRHPSPSRALSHITVFNIIGALIHITPLFIIELGIIERCIITILYAGTTALALNTNAGITKLYLPYNLIVLLALAGTWFFVALETQHTTQATILFFVIINYIFLLHSLGKNTGASILNELNLRKQQEALNKKLDDALKEAQNSNESKTRFLASASHDLRQPIHSIGLFSAALNTEPLSERAKEIVQHISNASHTVSQELDSLLDLSKLDANMITLHKTPVSITHLFSVLEKEFKNSAIGRSIDLRFDSGDFHVHTDFMSLQRILRNLISNALKYTHQGYIHVFARSINDGLTITVEDTGVGIAQEELTKVFEEFYQVNNLNRDKRKGIGLGLSIVKRLSRLLDFSITVDSTLGKGSSFTLLIDNSHMMEQSTSEMTEINPHIAPMPSKNQQILIIDDEVDIIKGMEYFLESYEFDLLTATSYEQGLQVALTHKPDLIISDYRLDKHDGIHLINSIREVHDIPAFLISGDTAPEKLQTAEASGIEMLHKPVAHQKLLKKTISYLQQNS